LDLSTSTEWTPGQAAARKARLKAWRWIGLTVIVLTGMRLLWVQAFLMPEQRHIVNGELDLRDAAISDRDVLALDGTWMFYPYSLLMDGNPPANDGRPLKVPGGWNDVMQPDRPTPNGYGSYRLRILTDPGDTTTYALHVSSIRSASELYVNGRLLARNGQPAEREADAKPKNVPFTAAFTADESGMIEIIVQASNYNDPRRGGIVRSLRFGSESAIKWETQLSSAMQQMTLIACLIFAIYTLIVYFIGTRETRMLSFTAALLCAVFVFGEGGEKLFLVWFSIPYELDFKLKFLALFIGSCTLLQSVRPRPLGSRGVWVLGIYQAIGAAFSIAVVLLPFESMLSMPFMMYSYIGISMLASAVLIIRMKLADRANRIYMIIAALAFLNNFLWDDFMIRIGVKTIYYPFDLLVAMIAFSCVWIGRYFRTFAESKALADRLQLEDKRKDEFLANTSHELRNPLHGILNLSQNVLERERDHLGGQSVKDLETALAVGRRMSYMLGDLLDTMRLKHRSIVLRTETVSLHALSAGVVAMLRYLTIHRPVRLVNGIARDFPPIAADGNRLSQILFNLLHNALKYTNEGEVTVRASIEGNDAFVQIEDTGIGMDESTLQRVFEPYEQADAEQAAASGGFGLGLGISKQLVELHGSVLEVRSMPGRGTTFSFRLPLADDAMQSTTWQLNAAYSNVAESEIAYSEAAVGTAEDHAALPTPASAGSSSDRIAILAVDDDRVNLQVLAGMLAPESRYDIVFAHSGPEALQLLNTRQWDLIVADVMMPRMTGMTLTQLIRDRFDVYELPILLLTARTRPEDIEAGFLAGANDYVTKPVNAIELRARVKALTQFKQAVSDRLGLEAAWHQAQIKPHFILNTLNAVASLSEENVGSMRELLVDFSDYLRESFDFRHSNRVVPLEQELNLVRAYLNVEKTRFQERLNIAWEIDANVPLNLEIPPLSLQPIVENAVKHGVLKKTRGGTLSIRITDHAQAVRLTVEDDGPGIENETLALILNRRTEPGQGIGLRNTNLRLKRLYGTGLHFERAAGQSMRVSFEVPKNPQRRGLM